MRKKNSTATKCQKAGKTNALVKDDSSKAIKPLPRRQSKLDQALRALNLTREQIAVCPQIESVLKQSVGSVAQAIEAMRFSSDPTIARFLLRYDKCSGNQKATLPLEAFALAAEVEIPALLGATILAFKSLQAQKSTLRVMADHPAVVETTIEQAKKARGVADRRMIHEAVGFLPTKAGISINQVFGGQLPQKREERPVPQEENGEPAEFDELFEPITQNLEAWQANRQKLLKG